jgi:hypothetical protein
MCLTLQNLKDSESRKYCAMVCPVSDSQFVLAAPEHQVAIFDATNSTEERRKYLIERFHGRVQYLFIESICNDEATLKRNTELKLKYSPDYGDVDPKQVQPLASSVDLESCANWSLS